MATLTRVHQEAKAFSPDRLNEEQVAVLFRATLNLFRLWDLSDEQAATILDLTRRTYARWKAGDVGRIGRDGQSRLSNLMGIHKALRTMFHDPARGYAWIKARNEAFEQRSALEVMLGGALTDLMRVRRYLDAERGVW